MRHACCGCTPRVVRRHAPRVVAVGLLLALTGCAADKTAQIPSIPSAFSDSPPSYTAQVHAPRVETEGDGLPSQPPPLRRMAGADDPREPWSPNYGSVPASPAATIATAPVSEPTPVSTTARVAMVIKQPFSLFGAQPVDEDDVIRRAIAAHEMRRED
jgi:hypothetical protein